MQALGINGSVTNGGRTLTESAPNATASISAHEDTANACCRAQTSPLTDKSGTGLSTGPALCKTPDGAVTT